MRSCTLCDDSTPFGFTGQYQDDESGMLYLRAREYDPLTQQFLSRDPLQSQAGQPYVYANRNPVNFTDPTGTTPLFDDEEGGAELPPPGPEPQSPAGAGSTVEGGGGGSGAAWSAEQGASIEARNLLAENITNPVPSRLARVYAGDKVRPYLGPPSSNDPNTGVFVTAAEDIAGLTTPQQVYERLALDEPSDVYTVIEFDTPLEGIASPINRNFPKFVGRGRTLGGAREFVIPNGPVPPDAITRFVR